MGGNSRWDGERRASPVCSLLFASLDPFVSNIGAGCADADQDFFYTRQDPSVLAFARNTKTPDIPSFATDFLMRYSN